MGKGKYVLYSPSFKAMKYADSIKYKTIYSADAVPMRTATPKEIAYMQGYLDARRDLSNAWRVRNGMKPKTRVFKKKK